MEAARRMGMDKVKSWIGKKVVCVDPERESSPTRRKLLKIGQVYEVEDVSVGNYCACIRLKGMPKTVYSEYARRDVPVCFDWRAFQLVKEDKRGKSKT